MAISLLPTFTLTASATTEKNIMLGTSALKGGQASSVWFGNYQQSEYTLTNKLDSPTNGALYADADDTKFVYLSNTDKYYKLDPIKWRVLDADCDYDGKKVGDGETDESRGVFLLSDQNLDVEKYHTKSASVTWAESTIRSWLNGYDGTENNQNVSYSVGSFINNAFSSDEQKAIVQTSLTNPNNPDYNTVGGNPTQDRIFLLSIAEATNKTYGFDTMRIKEDRKRISSNTAYVAGGGKTGSSQMKAVGNADNWWLRSPGYGRVRVVFVEPKGNIHQQGNDVTKDYYAVRPALNLDSSKILFTSAAKDGKNTDNIGTLAANTGNTSGEYKLTMLDESRDFCVFEIARYPKLLPGGTLSFGYTAEEKGDNEYISVMLVNKDGEVAYYGHAEPSETLSGTSSFTVPSDIAVGDYQMYIFNEQINGDYKTDYSSKFQKFTLNVEKPIDNSITLTAPVRKAEPQTKLETDEYTATVAWSPDAEDKFAARTAYTATITITPKKNYTTEGITEFKVDGAESVELKSNDGTTAIIEAVFPKTKGGASYAAGTVVGGGGVAGGNAPKNDNKKDDIAEPNDTAEPDDKEDDENGGNAADQNPVNGEWENPYADVAESDWFYEYVKYADVNGLMNGTDGENFAPNENITRGMFVTVLYRAEGEPAVNKRKPFADVSADKYYANAVIWAQQNGIVKGYSETVFAPDDFITREQIAAIIHRYAQYKGYDVSVGESTNILSYDDFDEISEYAISAVQYAVGRGLMKGKTETTLNPKDFTTRAEIAAILQRFIEGNK